MGLFPKPSDHTLYVDSSKLFEKHFYISGSKAEVAEGTTEWHTAMNR